MEQYYVVVDIGGTAIKYGLTDASGNFFVQDSQPTKVIEDGGMGIVHKVVAIVQGFKAQYNIAGVAIDTAGIVKPEPDGEIIYAGEKSFPGYSGIKLGKIVSEACALPCTVENDVNAAAMGEYWQGAAKGAASAFVMTVGTGIGGAILIDGKIFSGASFSAGELGFSRLHGENRILEEVASTRAMLNEAACSHNMSPAELHGETVFKWAKQGDVDAVLAIEHMTDALSEGIANVCALLNPEVIVLGGGIMKQREYLYPRLSQRLKTLVPPAMLTNTRLVFAELGNAAGMIGSLYNFLQRNK